MKNFKDLGVKSDFQTFVGDKRKMHQLLNRVIIILDYKIVDSKYKENCDKCLHLQLQIGDVKHVAFTGSKPLMDTLEKVPKTDFPFTTTIVKENDWYEFT